MPLFVGMDTHALSEAAFASALEVFAANNATMEFQKVFGTRLDEVQILENRKEEQL